jgi:hypothetical protein
VSEKADIIVKIIMEWDIIEWDIIEWDIIEWDITME